MKDEKKNEKMKGLKTGHFPTNFDTYLCLRKIPSNALLVERMGCLHDANAYFSSLELYLAHIQAGNAKNAQSCDRPPLLHQNPRLMKRFHVWIPQRG